MMRSLLVILLLWLHAAMCSNRVVVTFESSLLAAGVKSIANATVVKQYGRRLVLDLGRPIELPEDWIYEAVGVGGVVSIEEDIFVEIEGMVFANEVNTMPFQWNLADSEPHSIHVEGMWRNTNSTPDVVVAVLDTGLAYEAMGLFLHMGSGFDFISDPDVALDGDGRDADSTDPGDSGVDCPDPSWHGTKVSSVLSARHRPEFKGVAQNITLLSIRVLGLCSKGYSNDVTDAIVWAAGLIVPSNLHFRITKLTHATPYQTRGWNQWGCTQPPSCENHQHELRWGGGLPLLPAVCH